MAIDRIPKVGRYLLTESILRDEYFGNIGKITRLGGKSTVYYTRHHDDPTRQDEEERRCSVVGAVCDTLEEAKTLKAFSRQCRDERVALRNRHDDAFQALFTDAPTLPA